MALPIFPALPGITWPVKRAPGFSNTLQTALSGRRTAVRHQIVPRWSYEVQVEFLRNQAGFTEFRDLLALYLACNGSYGTFLFDDADDDSATDQSVGIGDGATVAFPLVRMFAGFVERVAVMKGVPIIKVAGAAAAAGTYAIDVYGVVTFTNPPAAGAAITWTGGFYWVCRFDDDQLDLSQFMSKWWEVRSLKFSTEIITS